MDRREFFQTSIIATLAAKVLGDATLARRADAGARRRPRRPSPPRRRRRAG